MAAPMLRAARAVAAAATRAPPGAMRAPRLGSPTLRVAADLSARRAQGSLAALKAAAIRKKRSVKELPEAFAEQAASPKSSTIEGVVESVVFAAPETGYVVTSFRADAPSGKGAKITVVGYLGALATKGATLRVRGRWIKHAKFGYQFQAAAAEERPVSSSESMEGLLGSGLLPGVGPELARRIVARFGAEAGNVIESAPQRLLEVEGIGKARKAAIEAAWREQKDARDNLLFLQQLQVPPAAAVKLHAKFGPTLRTVIREDPYQIARVVGFRAADRIAQRAGVQVNHPSRIRAGLLHCTQRAAEFGHCFIEGEQLVQHTQALLFAGIVQISAAAVRAEAAALVANKQLVSDAVPRALLSRRPDSLSAEQVEGALREAETGPAQAQEQQQQEEEEQEDEGQRGAGQPPHAAGGSEAEEVEEEQFMFADLQDTQAAQPPRSASSEATVYYLPSLFSVENKLAELLHSLLDPRRSKLRQQSLKLSRERVRSWLAGYQRDTGVALTEEQQMAVERAAMEGVSVVTGGPGCGKTFTLRAIVALWKDLGLAPLLTSPTGRGAYKLSEMARHPASTIHRALEYDHKTHKFRRNERVKFVQEVSLLVEASCGRV
jgi:exodeoxyribonuclease V alpha subunit